MSQNKGRAGIISYLISPRVFISKETSSKYGVFSLGPFKELLTYVQGLFKNNFDEFDLFNRTEYSNEENFTAFLIYKSFSPSDLYKLYSKNAFTVYVNLFFVTLVFFFSLHQLVTTTSISFVGGLLSGFFLFVSTSFFLVRVLLFSYYNDLIENCVLPNKKTISNYVFSMEYCFSSKLKKGQRCLDLAYLSSILREEQMEKAILGLPTEIADDLIDRKQIIINGGNHG